MKSVTKDLCMSDARKNEISNSLYLLTFRRSVRAGLSRNALTEIVLMDCKDRKYEYWEARIFARELVREVYCDFAEAFEKEFCESEEEDLDDLVTLVYDLPDKKKKKKSVIKKKIVKKRKSKKAKGSTVIVVNDAEDRLEESGVEPDLDAPEGAQWVDDEEDKKTPRREKEKDEEDEVPPGEGDGDEKPPSNYDD